MIENENKPLFTEDDLGRKVVNDADLSMLRSILEKDNERIKDEIAGVKGEVVFRVGYEGGGFEVTRFTTKEGKEYFVTSGTNMTLDDDGDEDWIQQEDAPTASFEGSLKELGMGKNLIYCVPLRVHPDYAEPIRQYITKLFDQLTGDERKQLKEFSKPQNADEWIARARP